jgi:ribosome biogenesis protein YTM1
VSNLIGHTASVDDCDINPSGTLIVSAGWDAKIKLWQLPKPGAEEDSYAILDNNDVGVEDEEDEPRKKKKRRVEPQRGGVEVSRRAVESLSEHTGPVSAVRFASSEEVISASWDHSIKFWDIQSAVITTNIIAKDVLQCLGYNQEKQLVITGHADGTVRLWDRRSQHAEVSTLFSSHSIWVSAVAFHPTRSEVFASASYDKTVKLWDARAKTPLSSIGDEHTEKILCAEWLNDTVILSGSADKTLKSHALR